MAVGRLAVGSTGMDRPESCDAALPCGAEVALEIEERGIKEFAARDDNDIEPGCQGRLVPEQFADESFRAVPANRVAQLARGHDPQPGGGRRAGQEDQSEIPRGDPVTGAEGLLELASPAHALRLAKRVRRHRAWRYDEETVKRLRPLARRRLSTRRPFLVAIRVRNP